MNAIEHSRILAIGFAIFAAIFAFTFLLLMLVSLGVFVALGITFTKETGDPNQAGLGIVGGVFAVIFYGVMGLIFVLPTASAAWKLWKSKRSARTWSIIASILLLPVLPMGTALGIYGLWFLFRSVQPYELATSPAGVLSHGSVNQSSSSQTRASH